MEKARDKDRDSLIFRGKTKNFSEGEFYCKCGCGTYNMRETFIMRLQYARIQARIPMIINSGCRCAKHNAAVGGKGKSWHLTGHAADICADPDILAKYGGSITQAEIMGLLLPALLSAKFKRIGIYFDGKFIHVDNGNWNKNQAVKIWGG